MLSVVTVRILPRYRAYFERRLKQGKAKMHILVAIGRKLLCIPYDPDWEENRHLALARR